MDIDRFVVDNNPAWERMDQLCGRHKRLRTEEVEELGRLYLRASGHLAYAQAHFSDPDLLAALTARVARTSALVYGRGRHNWRSFGRFFTTYFPLAVYESGWFVLASALAVLVPAFALGTWLDHSNAALDALAPAAVRQAYVDHDFSHYYVSVPATQFAVTVYTNNVKVALEAFAGGISFGVLTLVALVFNGLDIGGAGGLFYAAHRPAEFWGLVLPHGLLEMSSVVIAGAAGLRLGWALVAPGDRTRSAALAGVARRCTYIAAGTFLTLAVSGIIEGFVAGSTLPTAVRVGTGITVEVLFLVWVIGAGRAARRRGADLPGRTGPTLAGTPAQSRPAALMSR
ncbi:MAG TPA: stage II sporulation protein M [Acidimicrobiales bacterium]|nr:stage II sporulation protein M [Acidimicrobiales bacterium]